MKPEKFNKKANGRAKGSDSPSKIKSDKSKIFKGVLTLVLFIERIWRIIKNYLVEIGQ